MKQPETYDMDARCANCGTQGTNTYAKGSPAGVKRCPKCGNKTMHQKRSWR